MMNPDLLCRSAEAGNSAVILKWLAEQNLSQFGVDADQLCLIDTIEARSQTDSVSHSVFAP